MEQRRLSIYPDSHVARSSGKPTTVTRQYLYDEIWRTSTRSVARELGISANRLAKICDRFRIPHPETPYGGGLDRAPPLPTAPQSATDTITITSSDARLTPNTQSSEVAGGHRNQRSYHPELNSWLRDHLAWVRSFVGSSPEGERDKVPPKIRRLLRVADVIFHAAQKKGLVPKLAGDRRLRFFDFLYDGVPIRCELRDTKKQVTGPGGRKQFQRTGSLLFSIKNVKPRDFPGKVEWHERLVGPLPNRVDEIIAALLLAGPVAVRGDRERVARQRRWETERLEARRREDAAKREMASRQALHRAAEDYRTARNLADLIQELERANTDLNMMIGERSLADWLAWTKVQRDCLDPLSRGTATFFESINSAKNPTSKSD